MLWQMVKQIRNHTLNVDLGTECRTEHCLFEFHDPTHGESP